MKTPDKKVMIVLGSWLVILALYISTRPAGRGNPTPFLLARPGDAVLAVLLVPAHPLLVPCAIGAPLNLSLTAAGMSDNTYFRFARLTALPGRLLIFGLAAFDGYRGPRLLFYLVLAGLSLVLLIFYATAFGIHT